MEIQGIFAFAFVLCFWFTERLMFIRSGVLALREVFQCNT